MIDSLQNNLISIICPIFNAENYILRMIQSICGQSYPNIEIICVNDGSTDNTLTILNKFAKKDRRIKIITQDNLGPAAARNIGLKNSSGKYIMFCDSDDWYDSDMCKIMYETIEETKADVVMCNTAFEYETPEIKRISIQQDRINERYYNHTGKKIYKINSKIRFKTNVLLWNKIWRMDIIKRYNIKFPDGREHDDDAFWYIYSFCSKRIFYLSNALYHYTIRKNSIMDKYFSGHPKNHQDRILISNFVFNFLDKQGWLKNHMNDILYLYSIQMEQSLKFFNSKEKIDILKNINLKLNNEISPNIKIIISKNNKIAIIRNIIDKLKIIFKYHFYKFIGCVIKGYKQKKLAKLNDFYVQLHIEN